MEGIKNLSQEMLECWDNVEEEDTTNKKKINIFKNPSNSIEEEKKNQKKLKIQDTKRIIKTLKRKTKQHINVIYHALIVTSGDVKLAQEYLNNYKEFQKKNILWKKEEDNLLLSKNPDLKKLQYLISKRGKSALNVRMEWLES